jgi:hypothetical protein
VEVTGSFIFHSDVVTGTFEVPYEPEGDLGELQQDALVEKLIVDPSQIPDVQVLIGLLGRSSEPGKQRLYLNPQLNSFLEFSAEDVVHTASLSTAQSPLGGTMVWLRRDATVKYTRTGTLQAQAEFVQGDIMSSFMTGPGMQNITLGRPVEPFGGRAFPSLLAFRNCGITHNCDLTQGWCSTWINCPRLLREDL